ncbi:hypothetical protein [Sphingomonas sp.]|uniref:hypothetical protein n=1 Tax=Sphingomonas sp. TaxID=28214 RepID=UPI003B00498E
MIVALAFAITTSGLVVYSCGGWNYSHSSVSPDGKYRVDLYTANRWQWMTHILSYEEPGFARLSRTSDNRMIDTSGVITLMDSNVTWLPDVVVVGTQTRHKLPEGRWE